MQFFDDFADELRENATPWVVTGLVTTIVFRAGIDVLVPKLFNTSETLQEAPKDGLIARGIHDAAKFLFDAIIRGRGLRRALVTRGASVALSAASSDKVAIEETPSFSRSLAKETGFVLAGFAVSAALAAHDRGRSRRRWF